MRVRAGSTPPMTSTTRSMSGSATMPAGSSVSTPGAKSTGRGRVTSLTATRATSRRRPVRAATASPLSATSCTSAAPTLPQPSSPMRTVELPSMGTKANGSRLLVEPQEVVRASPGARPPGPSPSRTNTTAGRGTLL